MFCVACVDVKLSCCMYLYLLNEHMQILAKANDTAGRSAKPEANVAIAEKNKSDTEAKEKGRNTFWLVFLSVL